MVLDIDTPKEKTSTKTSNDEGDFITINLIPSEQDDKLASLHDHSIHKDHLFPQELDYLAHSLI